MKKFLISIDTEGDNQWEWSIGKKITTENSKYIERFHNLCKKFGYIPTYLVNYEMATDNNFIQFGQSIVSDKTGEIGMHTHAWNILPDYKFEKINKCSGAPYLTEYPKDIIAEKISCMTNILESTFGTKMVSHRSGRWAMDAVCFKELEKKGYIVDCSVTPHINWSDKPGESLGSKGPNYLRSSENPYIPEGCNSLIEIPMTVRTTHKLFPASNNSFKSKIARYIKTITGQNIWLRPNGHNLTQMRWLLERIIESEENEYIMFMLHSSELMPGGSPTFKTTEAIECLYKHMEEIFKEASTYFEGMSIGEFGIKKIRNIQMKL